MLARPRTFLPPHRLACRSSRNGVERLELRQLLSAVALVGPPDLMSHGAWTAAEAPSAPTDVPRIDHSLFVGPADRYAEQPAVPMQPVPSMEPILPASSPFNEGRVPDSIERPDLGSERVVFVEPPEKFSTPEPLLVGRFEPVPPELVLAPSPLAVVVPSGPMSRTSSPNSTPLSATTVELEPQPSSYVDPLATDSPSDRVVMAWIIESWQPAGLGQMPGPDDVPADSRFRAVEVSHGAVVDPRVTIAPLDGGRGAGADPFAGGEQANGHHAPNFLTALVGQSAAGDAVSIVGSSTVGDRARSLAPVPGDDDQVAEKLSERTTVGYLVAFDEMAAALGFGAVALTTRPSLLAEAASPSLLDELLTPQFTCDVAALTVAIDEIAAQAEEIGVGLLGILAEPVASGEAALVAGLLGAGLAYRHWRGGSGQTPSEEQELLAARFLHGPASLRLARRAGA